MVRTTHRELRASRDNIPRHSASYAAYWFLGTQSSGETCPKLPIKGRSNHPGRQISNSDTVPSSSGGEAVVGGPVVRGLGRPVPMLPALWGLVLTATSRAGRLPSALGPPISAGLVPAGSCRRQGGWSRRASPAAELVRRAPGPWA